MRFNNDTIILCKKGSNCCPEISFDAENNATIKDDFGGSVKLDDFQFNELAKAVRRRKKYLKQK